MTALITTVGDSDPIRAFRDGAILHICRKYQPNQLIIIHSERTEKTKVNLEKAIFSVYQDKQPTITYKATIPNDMVFRFDLIYSEISAIINDCLVNLPKNEEVILNLSSGTPQMKSALFTYFQIRDFPSKDIHIRAIQVASPKKDSNQGEGHQNTEDIDILIEMNEDNGSEYRDRCHEEIGLNFKSSLQKRTLKELLQNYDYQAFYHQLRSSELLDLEASRRRDLEKFAKNLSDVFRYHKNVDRDLRKKVGKTGLVFQKLN